MNKQQKQLAGKKKREQERRRSQQRRVESNRCAELMLAAEIAWDVRDYEDCQRLLEKVLRIRPGHAEALERIAQTCFLQDRYEEGLSYYDRMDDLPRWLPVIYGAAIACWNTGRFERCIKLTSEFLEATRGSKEFAPTRNAAKGLARDAQRRIRASSRPAAPQRSAGDAQPNLFSGAAEAAPAVIPTPAPAQPPTPPAAVSPQAPVAKPELLTPFPTIPVPVIPVRFDIRIPAAEDVVAPLAEALFRRDYALLKLQRGFDELVSPSAVRGLEHFSYQIETVRRVLRDFRGRALLADEVGLGKTIEACLTLKEYWMRGLVRKALILTPPSLTPQWIEELSSKFGLAAASPESGGYAADPDGFWAGHDLVVASLALARTPANRERLSKIEYGMVIVDEAHTVRNRATAAWQLVNALKKRFLLLLSATPAGNDLAELYNLVLLLRPGLLGTEAQFRRDYGQNAAGQTRLLGDPERRDRLRGLLREVMVRNTRAHIDLKLPRRLAATERVIPDALEAEILAELGAFVRKSYAAAAPAERMRLMTLQMQAGSSPSALRYGLRDSAASGKKDAFGPAAHFPEKLARLQRSAKTDALIRLARRSREKKIVFTRFLATLEEVEHALEAEGFRVSIFHGRLTTSEKEAAIADFREHSEILLSSESGGEGRNLQFCNTVINYDLPWNPATIEQRVGRVHRIGQNREVYVFNLCLAGSVEEYVLQVLHEKINLFELVAGEMEMILGELGQEQDFAGIVMDLWAGSGAEGGTESAFDRFALELQTAKAVYQKSKELDQALLGEDYEV